MSEWISVIEKMPKDGDQVILFIRTEHQAVDYDTDEAIGNPIILDEIATGYISDGKLWIHYDQYNFSDLKDVTHWMPLPEPPK